MPDEPIGSPEERAVIDAIAGMLARPDFLIPIAAAERQFRDHYYGLNSAALLEDLFFDALGNYLRQTSPSTELLRPATGQKGWDYTFDGLNVSHKVSQKLDVVAALWDATKRGVTHWSFDDPIVYVLSHNTPPTSVEVIFDGGTTFKCRAIADLRRPYLADGRALLVVDWSVNAQPLLMDTVSTDRGQGVVDALRFSRVWGHVAGQVKAGKAANNIDVLATNRRSPPLTQLLAGTPNPRPIDLHVPARSGVYLFPRVMLQNLNVKSNNRAILIPKDTIAKLVDQAFLLGLYTPLPLWYTVYAQERPPDMYSAQRAEYDARFSARGELDR